MGLILTLLHSERPKLYGVLAVLSVIGLKEGICSWELILFAKVDTILKKALVPRVANKSHNGGKYVHEVLVNCLGGLNLPRKSVVRLTDHPDMAIDVYRGCKTTQQQESQRLFAL